MILGSGLLARAFESFRGDDRVLVFASGVSNSSTATEADHARERNLLLQQAGTTARLVYFSTCSLFDPTLADSGYIRHKLQMEELIRARFPDHTILRLPNVVGHTPNPHTLCNYIRDQILSGRTINVQVKARRYLMDVDMVTAACSPLVLSEHARSKSINICFDHPVPVPELVKAMERVLRKKAVIKEVVSGSCYYVDHAEFKQYWHAHLNLPWPAPDHWHSMLTKYYGEAMPSNL